MSDFLKIIALAAATAVSLSATAQTAQSWMNSDVSSAWKQGFKGQNTTIQVVDDFNSTSRYYGNLGTGLKQGRHGEWTYVEASMVAPRAKIIGLDYMSTATLPLTTGLNIVNISFSLYSLGGYSVSQIGWDNQDVSIIRAAQRGAAVISKAAGNDTIAIGGITADGKTDYLNKALIGAPSAIFVGALNTNGSKAKPAKIAPYSNIAGGELNVQKNFLVVGVDSTKTGLAGTSFAAPIVSGYASIVGSKFTTATATQITNQLLTTARTDTIANYKATVHGRGEASLSRALAPSTIK